MRTGILEMTSVCATCTCAANAFTHAFALSVGTGVSHSTSSTSPEDTPATVSAAGILDVPTLYMVTLCCP